MYIVVVIACFLAVVADDDHGSNALSYTADNFDSEIEKATNNFVMFFAPWCGHCKRLAPTWDELGNIYNNDPESEVRIAKVDCTTDTSLCAKHDVSGYPTLKFFKKGIVVSARYKGSRDTESLQGFIEEQLGKGTSDDEQETPASDSQATNQLVELTDKTFEKHIEMGSHFIKFYAPWCGHCQRLAPTWETLANTYSSDKSVSIAKLDCTAYKIICDSQQVKGYPSLYFFKNGIKVDEYQGGRSHGDLRAYVDKMLQKEDIHASRTDEKIIEYFDELPESFDEDKKHDDTPPGVFELEDISFDDAIADRVAFVKFYAPWCGHCKKLAPTWEDLAIKYHKTKSGHIDPAIAKVDCTQQKLLCGKHKVRGYPTLLLFKQGQLVTEYTGPRDLDSLQNFMDEHSKDFKKRDEL